MEGERDHRDSTEGPTPYRFGPRTPPVASGGAGAVEPPSTHRDDEDPGPTDEVETRRDPRDHATEDGTTDVRPGIARAPEPEPRADYRGRCRGDVLFGKYRLLELLGRGGMGEVWLARHEVFRDEMALKLIVPGAVIDDETLERFALEARVMRALSRHPHAVVVHDAEIDVDRGMIYIVMDVVHGRSVDKLLTPGVPMPLDWTMRVLEQLGLVLQEAHERGIVHRDLSPSNLMLEDRPDGQVHLKVLDFGIAKVLDPETGVFGSVPRTEDGRFFGKRSYASPEQLEGRRVDSRSDLYSVGVLLYQFLTGHRPFPGGPEGLAAGRRKKPPRFRRVSPDVRLPGRIERVVRRCLAEDPEDRPRSALELVELFRAALGKGGEPSVVTQEGPPPPPWPAWWRAILGAMAIGLIAVAGLASFPLVRGWLRDWTTPLYSTRPAVIAFLEERGYRAVPGSGTNADGLPRLVERPGDHRRLAAHVGVYLPEGYRSDGGEGAAGGLPAALVRKDGSRFLLIRGGEFPMGAFDGSIGDFCDEEKPGHEVRLSDFYMQETEVTFGEFERFCNERGLRRKDPAVNDFYYARDAQLKRMSEDELRRHPAVCVPRSLAEAYARHVGGELPTEAQWEYAARSRGKARLYVWGNDSGLSKDANIHRSVVTGIETHPVGRSKDDRTEQGVFDLSGNVREWCRDVWKPYPEAEPGPDPVRVPTPDDANPLFVIRGGSYRTPPETARTTWRRDLGGGDSAEYRARNDHDDLDLGFRVVLEVFEVPKDVIAGRESKAGSPGERAR
jgi:eukaryotic-like serine/threonine-protein kinase